MSLSIRLVVSATCTRSTSWNARARAVSSSVAYSSALPPRRWYFGRMAAPLMIRSGAVRSARSRRRMAIGPMRPSLRFRVVDTSANPNTKPTISPSYARILTSCGSATVMMSFVASFSSAGVSG